MELPGPSFITMTKRSRLNSPVWSHRGNEQEWKWRRLVRRASLCILRKPVPVWQPG